MYKLLGFILLIHAGLSMSRHRKYLTYTNSLNEM